MNDSPATAKATAAPSSRRRLVGVVVSHTEKTATVRVERTKTHHKYHRQYTVRKTFLAHDAQNRAQVGDTVTIVASRPRSRRKRWMILSPTTPSV